LRVCAARKVTRNLAFDAASRPPAEIGENFLRRFHAVILGFLENGDAAEIGVGERDAVVEALDLAALFGENLPDSRANHGMSHAHYIDARDALPDVAVNALEIAQNCFLPVGPVFFEQELTVL